MKQFVIVEVTTQDSTDVRVTVREYASIVDARLANGLLASGEPDEESEDYLEDGVVLILEVPPLGSNIYTSAYYTNG